MAQYLILIYLIFIHLYAIDLGIEFFEAEQKKFSVNNFDQLITKLREVQVPPGWIIFHPNSTTVNVTNLTLSHPILFQNYLSIDDSLHVISYRNEAPVVFNFKQLTIFVRLKFDR